MTRRAALASGVAVAGVAAAGPSGAAGRFAMPAEEARHLRTFMQWPVSRAVYDDPVFLRMTQDTIAQIANTINAFEPVVMLADVAYHPDIQRKVSADVEIWDIATDDLWCRDAGPLFVNDGAGAQAIRHLNFNGWGGKQSHRNDGRIAAKIAARLGLDLLDNGLVGEAGGVDQDGHGVLIAHESSWINPNRNPQNKAMITALLNAAFGTDRVIWAPGIAGQDITDYHIDSLARFTGPGRVLIQMPGAVDDRDPWSRAAQETFDILRADPALSVDVITEPRRPRVRHADFVASYANYYVCNGAVICAAFGDEDADAAAMAALARHYPGREIIALNVDPLGELGGGIHCATQQQPLP